MRAEKGEWCGDRQHWRVRLSALEIRLSPRQRPAGCYTHLSAHHTCTHARTHRRGGDGLLLACPVVWIGRAKVGGGRRAARLNRAAMPAKPQAKSSPPPMHAPALLACTANVAIGPAEPYRTVRCGAGRRVVLHISMWGGAGVSVLYCTVYEKDRTPFTVLPLAARRGHHPGAKHVTMLARSQRRRGGELAPRRRAGSHGKCGKRAELCTL